MLDVGEMRFGEDGGILTFTLLEGLDSHDIP